MDPRSFVGQLIDGKYQIESIAGSGGMGVVYRALQVDLERTVALKVLQESLELDTEWQLRFEREAQVLSRISHRNIGTIYNFGIFEGDIPYIAMEYVEGRSLRSVLQEKEKLGWQRTVLIGLQLTDALTHIHANGILHRDLSANNVFLVDDSGKDLVKIIDFGLSKMIVPETKEVQRLTQTGALMGSIHYMSPELCSGHQTDFRSDIYSLACILYECLTGHVPFTADNPIGIMHKHVNESVKTPSTGGLLLPLGLDEVMLKALAKDPDKRYQSMAQFHADLKLIADADGGNSIAYQEWNKIPEKNTSRKLAAVWLLSSVLVFVLGLGAFAAFLWFTPAGLDIIVNCLFYGKVDQSRMSLLMQIIDRDEELAGPGKANDLRKRVFARAQIKHGDPERMFLAAEFAGHYAKLGLKPEACYWAAQGIKELPTLDSSYLAWKEDRIVRVIERLCEICIEGKNSNILSPIQVNEISMTSWKVISNSERHNKIGSALMDLQIAALRRQRPGSELIRCLLARARELIAEKKNLALARRDCLEALKWSNALADPGFVIDSKLVLAELLCASGEKNAAVKVLRDCRGLLNEESGYEQKSKYVVSALKCSYLAGLESIYMMALEVYRRNLYFDGLSWMQQVAQHMRTSDEWLRKRLIADAYECVIKEERQSSDYLFRAIVVDFTVAAGVKYVTPELESIMKARINYAREKKWIRNAMMWSLALADSKRMKDERKEAVQIKKAALAEFSPLLPNSWALAQDWDSYFVDCFDLGLFAEATKALNTSWEKSEDDGTKLVLLKGWVGRPLTKSLIANLGKKVEELQVKFNEFSPEGKVSFLYCKGRLLMLSGEHKKAESVLTESLNLAREIGSEQEQREIVNELMTIYHQTANYDKAIALVKEIDVDKTAPGFYPVMVMSDLLIVSNRYSDAISMLQKPLESSDPNVRFDTAAKIIHCLNGLARPEQARALFLKHYNDAYHERLTERDSFRFLFANYLNTRMTKSQLDELMKIAENLEKDAIARGYREELKATWAFQRAAILIRQKQYDRALEIMRVALLKSYKGLAKESPHAFRNLYDQYLLTLADAKQWSEYDAAVDQAVPMVSEQDIRTDMIAVALLHSSRKNTGSRHAKIWASEIEKALADDKTSRVRKFTCCYPLAVFYFEQKQDMKSCERIFRIRMEKTDDLPQKVESLKLLGDWYRQLDDLNTAIERWNEALRLSGGTDKNLNCERARRLCDWYARLENRKESEKYLQELIEEGKNQQYSLTKRCEIYCTVVGVYALLKDSTGVSKYLPEVFELEKQVGEPDSARLSILIDLLEEAGLKTQASELKSFRSSLKPKISEKLY